MMDRLIFVDDDGTPYEVHRKMPITAFWDVERLNVEIDAISGDPVAFDRVLMQIMKLLIPGLPMRRIMALSSTQRLAFINWWAAERFAEGRPPTPYTVLSA